MAGTAHIESVNLLTVGGQCIIYVDEANNPKGYWWGTVNTLEVRESYINVKATITGGRCAFNMTPLRLEPVYSNLNEGTEPHVNYAVYPATNAIRHFLYRMLQEQKRVSELEQRLEFWANMVPEVLSRTAKKLGVDGPLIREVLQQIVKVRG